MATRIRIKRGTESQITGYTGPHFEGELAYATNTGNVFVNDGTAFINIGGGGATPTLQSVTDEGNTTTNNIGIGTSSPSYPLHVVGNSLVTGTQFIGDTFTRIQQGSGNLILSNSSSDGSVVLRTNSVEQMRLTSAGRVGIGTTNPISKLELQDGTFTVDNGNIDVFFGGISIDRNSANNTALKVNQRGTADIFALQDDGTDVLTVIDGGNVGIGTTSPADYYSNKLVVSAEDESGITLAATTNSAVNHIMFADGTTGSEAYRGYLSYNHLDDSMRIGVGSTERMRIGVNGAVAIGSTNTATGYALYVAGNVGVSGLATTGDITLGENRAIRNLGSTIIDIDSNNDGTADYFAVTKGGYVSSTTLLKVEQGGDVIVPLGNVGIGTTAPSTLLHLRGDSPTLRIEADGANESSIIELVQDGGVTGAAIKYNGASNIEALQFNTGVSDVRMTIKRTNGNVGIGTQSPSEKLEVNGNVKASKVLVNTTNTGYTFYSNGESRINNITFQSVGNDDYLQKVQVTEDFGLEMAGQVNQFLLGANDTNGQLNDYLLIDGNTQELRIRTASSDRLVVNSSGNVGIGTTAPDSKLTVSQSADSDGIKIIGFDDRSANNLTMHINSSGIGEILSNTGLRVNSLSGPTSFLYNGSLMLQIASTSVNVRDNVELAFGNDKDYSIGYNTADDTFRIVDGSNLASNTRLLINPTGNVGIGTTAPASLLHIARTSNGEVLRLQDTTNANQNYVFETEASGSFYGLNLKNSNTGDTIVNFSASGRLGIKTNNPDKAITINETADNDVQIKIGNHFGIGYTQSGQTRSVIGSTYGNDAAMMSFVLGGYTTASDKMTILGSGNVGIGTSAPDSKLHVKATSGIAFKVDPNSADKEWYIDTTNPDHLKKEGNLILNADPTNVHTSTKISFNIDGSNKASINSDGDLGVGTTAQTSKVHVDGTAMRQLRIGTAGGPSSNTDTSGAEGDIAYDDLYLYIKTGSGWGRVPLDFGF